MIDQSDKSKMYIKWAKWGLIIFIGFCVIQGAWFSVDQTEVANVRRFGTVQYPKDKPLGPGIHFKIPLIDTVDLLRVTLITIHIPPFPVLTVDNQKVIIDENFNYTISAVNAYHVMYEVGGSGGNIKEQIEPVAKDRTARVFASQNMVTVNAEREKIQVQVETNVSKSVEDLFGITPHSLQIAAITPSENFMASIDQATMAKNAAIAAQNELRTKEFQAQQVAATAKGAADAAIENARGQAEATRLNAEANKTKLVLEGEGLKESFAAQISPFGDVEKFIKYLNAKAVLNWNGQYPQIMSGGNGSGPTLIVPVPSMGQSK
jgi:modulator of FtsH protease HflC